MARYDFAPIDKMRAHLLAVDERRMRDGMDSKVLSYLDACIEADRYESWFVNGPMAFTHDRDGELEVIESSARSRPRKTALQPAHAKSAGDNGDNSHSQAQPAPKSTDTAAK